MFADGNDDKPTTQESYAGAISDGNTRLVAHRTSRADLIAASGMNVQRMGSALMRLASEWQSGAVPDISHAPSVKDLKKGGMDTQTAEAEARLAAARCVNWHLQEHMLRFQRMKTLPEVRAGLLFWARERGWEEAENIVGRVLQHFLAPVCPVCRGSGLTTVPGQMGRTFTRPCAATSRDSDKRCGDGFKVPKGQLKVPYGQRGRQLLSHMLACIGTASAEMREGAYRLRRPAQREEERGKQRHHAKVAQLVRADAEQTADARQDKAAVAQEFREGMMKVERRRKRPEGERE